MSVTRGYIVALLLLLITAAISVSTGAAGIGIKDISHIILGKATAVQTMIFYELRVPRLLLSLLAGAALSMCGVVFQGILKNPLADPYVFGISSGAALGCCAALISGVAHHYIPLGGFVGACLSMAIVYILAAGNNKMDMFSLLLAGIITGSFMSALLSFLMYISNRVEQVVVWIMGDLSQAKTSSNTMLAFSVAAAFLIFLMYSRELDQLLMGEEWAQSSGVNPSKVKKALFITASLLTGAVVASCGVIGFTGIVVPHFVRMLFGPVHRNLLIFSALFGAVFMGIADIISRVLIMPAEIPAGIITSLAGAPFFLYILVQQRRNVG